MDISHLHLFEDVGAPLTDEILADCDLTIIALYPQASMILTPTKGNIQDVEKVVKLFTDIGCHSKQR